MIPDIDKRAKKILFDRYWSAAGWRNEREWAKATSAEDFEYAKRAGLMFDVVQVSHDDIVKDAVKIVRKIDRRAVADAFVVSLTSRRLDLRSALGSYAVLQHLSRHTAGKSRGECAVCGVYFGPAETEDLNVLNFERLKWGGVRHDQLLYAGFDLKLFAKLPRVVPESADVKIFQDVVQAIEAVPPKTRSGSLQKHLAACFKSSKPERDKVIEILGFCGVLETEAHRGFLSHFVPVEERETPDVEMAYPACWWRRSDGINREAIAFWFGHLL